MKGETFCYKGTIPRPKVACKDHCSSTCKLEGMRALVWQSPVLIWHCSPADEVSMPRLRSFVASPRPFSGAGCIGNTPDRLRLRLSWPRSMRLGADIRKHMHSIRRPLLLEKKPWDRSILIR